MNSGLTTCEADDLLRKPNNFSYWFINALVIISISVLFLYNLYILLPRIVTIIDKHQSFQILLYPSILWMLMGSVLLFFRTTMWFFYRAKTPVTFNTAPSMTVVIPAYNEGKMVRVAIESVARANYPHDRLEIMVVDDGSKDDTWEHICQIAEQFPGLVTPLRHETNKGKRAALGWGIQRAKGEIVVSIDSDSVIDRNALLALAAPFKDPKIGAVAGKVLVYNRKGLIPRMLHARYIMSFDFLRAAESVYGNVFCCPGALSALRVSAVRPLVGRWMNQKFLGVTCKIGEDRAMTNFLFEAGYNTAYQNNAIVYTIVPESYKKLCKMLLRWDRSYVREEIRFARIILKRPPKIRLIALFDRIVTNFRYPILYASLVLLTQMVIDDPHVVIRLLIAIGLVSFLNMMYFLRSELSLEFLWGVAYAYYAFFSLSWIFPYAAFTLRKHSWLTR